MDRGRAFSIAKAASPKQFLAVDFYFESYAELGLQRMMVADQPRTDAFAAAIKEAIKGGETVIDVGTGSGLLAMLAANAGAKKVYALDQSAVAAAAKETVERNGMSGTIDVVNANASNFDVVEPVDLIVSEWLGHFGFAETMLDDVIACRDSNLKEGGRMLPSGVELMMAPVDSPILYEVDGPGFWKHKVHGIDFSHLERRELDQALAIKTQIPAADVIAEPRGLVKLDLAKASKEDVWQHGRLRFTIDRDGSLNGFAGWFVAELTPTVVLDTGPFFETTHWMQTYFAIDPIPVKAGQEIELCYDLTRHPVEPRSLMMNLTVGEASYGFTVG
ncbi:50S ribosomal protein L11 methyltransferase [Pelagicoccus sp. NFK12]|uniref:50S ribosomal protein L11 methyltransferase n=1 Tax=Pelagicoccus enzymogenes TaxID=2773457 RepID=A0A927IHI3_9BACT|nr:50S ribosomal protein L11 methyltransferase [Pelagicoccus enzymogenes]MBD5779743.1 50S ribosomal protein L11 methyltransferase [Pelagicoccus enzymogenes]